MEEGNYTRFLLYNETYGPKVNYIHCLLEVEKSVYAF